MGRAHFAFFSRMLTQLVMLYHLFSLIKVSSNACAAKSVKKTEMANAVAAVPAKISILDKCMSAASIATTKTSIIDQGPITSVI